MRRIVVGISGASGAIMGYRMLQALRLHADVETHLVISDGAARTFELETELALNTVIEQADYYYEHGNMAASISSGSFVTDGMIIVPCSMKTL